MLRHPPDRSIRGRLIFYNIALFALILPIVLVCVLMGERFLRLPEEFAQQHTILNEFYEGVQQMDVQARSHLYYRDQSGAQAFDEYWEQSHESLKALTQGFSGEENSTLRWRISLLENMIITYRETFEKLLQSPVGTYQYSTTYDFLVSTAQNIDRTRNEYSHMLTERVNQTIQNAKGTWMGMLVVMFIVLGLLLIIGIVFSIVTVRGITLPLQKMVQNIQKIKLGQYNLKTVNTSAYVELEVLCNAFTDMAESLDGYLQSLEQNVKLENKLLEQENENLRMNELLIKTEISSLQAQMNPHFLFNTLSMLSKMAYIEGSHTTSEMMLAVAELMRYNLDKSTKPSNLRGEIACLHNYIHIQNSRFGERITFRVAVDPNINNIIMPGMVMQPLVENAIIHGVSAMQSGAVIEVNVFCDPTDIYLQVCDNGVGMEPELVHKIISGEDASASHRHTSIGLHNVFRRLNLFFGDSYRLVLQSERACGTNIIITLPISLQKEDANVSDTACGR